MRKFFAAGLLAISANALAHDAPLSVTINPDVGHHHRHGHHHCRVNDAHGRTWVAKGEHACKRAMNMCRNAHHRHNRHGHGRCYVVR